MRYNDTDAEVSAKKVCTAEISYESRGDEKLTRARYNRVAEITNAT